MPVSLFDPSTRDFFWLLVRRDLKVRYAGSTLGGLWNLIHPLMMIAIYMTIFSSIMSSRLGSGAANIVDYGSLNYGVHLCAGLIPWLLFSDVLIRSSGVLIENSNLLQKVSFPPVVLFLSVFANAFLVNGSGYLAFLLILALLGKSVPLIAVGGLGIMALFGLAGMGLGMILSGLNVFFRDTAQILTVVMQFLFWFNPIVYRRELIFGAHTDQPPFIQTLIHAGQVLLTLNPFERFITATQSLFGVVSLPPSLLDWTIVLVFPPLCLVAGWVLFRRMLPDVRDCL